MKRLNSIYLLLTMLFAVSFVSCVDDNDDTEAPYLTVTPSMLLFGNNGQPQEGSQNYFEVATNRSWKATVQDNKSWVTLSKTEGEGNTQIEVSIPEGVNDEAIILIQVSNKIGVLKSETVTIKSGEVVPTMVLFNETMGTTAVASPLVSTYEGWNKTGSAATNVTYSGTNTSIRSSGNSSTGAYEGASGPNAVFFGTAPASFVINKVALTASQTNLRLNFGASRSVKNNGTYDNAFIIDNFEVALSADGTTWSKINYTKNEGDAKHPYFIYATADFTLKNAVSELYIKFTASESSVIRLDDITLATSAGGQEVDLEGGVAPEPTETVAITIPEIVGMIGSTAVAVDEKNNRFFEAIVMSDVTGGNYTANNLVVATEGATTAKNGITLYGSQVDPATLGVTRGDKVKITLTKSLAKAQSHNGLYQVTGAATDTWAKVEKIGTGNVAPITVTVDQMNEFQGMPVSIENATTTTAGVWANSSANLSHVVTVNGTNLTVFCKKGATSLVDVPFQATTATITGLVSIYNKNIQLVPRDAADVEAFKPSGDTPSISVSPTSLNFAAAGGTETITVTVTNQGEHTLAISELTGILSATLNGSTITVVAAENTETTAVSQDLTVSLSNGTNVVIPVKVAAKSSGDVNSFTMTSQQIVSGATGTVSLGTNSYGSQALATPSTWYTWTNNGIDFTGVKICVASAANGGGIQVQGNASTAANQGRISNVTPLGSIQSITLVLRVVSTSTYAPSYNLYAGNSVNPSNTDTKITNSPTMSEADGFKTYTHTYDLSSGDYSYFTIMNDLAGALYIDSIEVSYK